MKIDESGRSRPFILQNILCVPMVLILGFILSAGLVQAQDDAEPYIIGYTDVLSISFWQKPALDSEVRVGEDGMITLPVTGTIRAVGLTTAELAKNIVERMTFYQSPISQATVAVMEFNSRAVLVSGQVDTPSRLSYEKIPDLWRVILDAGGPTDDADLSRVRIIRKVDEESEIIDVDLYSIIGEGDISRAPQLQPGDLVNVPLAPFGVTMEPGERPGEGGKNVYFVLGSVTLPGVRNLEPGMDVLDALALAGGPTTEADLRNVRVVMKGFGYSNIVKIDLEEYVEKGSSPRYILHPEDTIVVPAREAGLFAKVLPAFGAIAAIITAVGTVVLLRR
jgi:protein involved in polysaccharide export with SLBB domain